MEPAELARTYHAMFDATAVGDFTDFDRLIRDDVEWVNDIGAGPWRRLAGKSAVYEMFAAWQGLFDGGFRHELIDLCAGADNVVMILREVGQAQGHIFDNLALYRYEVDAEGRTVRVTTFDRDRAGIESFWAAVTL